LPTWITAGALTWGYDEATLRLPSALAGTLTILAVWAMGVLSFGAETGLFAAGALTVAPQHVARSRRPGAGPWWTLFGTLTVFAFAWAVEEPRGGWREVLCAAMALLTCGCGYRALLTLAAVTIAAVVLAVREPRLRRLARRVCFAMLVLAAAAGVH